MKLTINQLILLLEIYRGTNDMQSKIGTYQTDINILKMKELIQDSDKTEIISHPEYDLTIKGSKLVQEIRTFISITLN